jgi:hypothetical protein
MEKTLQPLGDKLQQKMFSPFVYIFCALLVESVDPYLTDKRVRVSRTVVEKFVRQTVYKLMNGFEVKSGV